MLRLLVMFLACVVDVSPEQLVDQLGANTYSQREEASHKLKSMIDGNKGDDLVKLFEEAYKDTTDLEIKCRCNALWSYYYDINVDVSIYFLLVNDKKTSAYYYSEAYFDTYGCDMPVVVMLNNIVPTQETDKNIQEVARLAAKYYIFDEMKNHRLTRKQAIEKVQNARP